MGVRALLTASIFALASAQKTAVDLLSGGAATNAFASASAKALVFSIGGAAPGAEALDGALGTTVLRNRAEKEGLVAQEGGGGVVLVASSGPPPPLGHCLAACEAVCARAAGRCADCVVVHVDAVDAMNARELAPSASEALRLLFAESDISDTSPKVIFALHAADGKAPAQADALRWAQEAARRCFNAARPGDAYDPKARVDAMVVPIGDKNATLALSSLLSSKVSGAKSGAATLNAAVAGALKGGFAPVELPALEKAAAACAHAGGLALQDFHAALRPMKRKVRAAKIVADFPSKAQALKAATEGKLMELAEAQRYGGSAYSAALSDARASMLGEVDTALQKLYALQLVTIAGGQETKLKGDLMKELRKSGSLPQDRQQALVRARLFTFDQAAKRLSIETVKEGSTRGDLHGRSYRALEERLAQTAARFMETPAAQLLAQSKVEKHAKRQRPAKKDRGVKPRLDVVGMLNMVGVGGLEGFAAYQAGAMNFIMGVSNGNDGDYPLLMIQPKIHFDVAL